MNTMHRANTVLTVPQMGQEARKRETEMEEASLISYEEGMEVSLKFKIKIPKQIAVTRLFNVRPCVPKVPLGPIKQTPSKTVFRGSRPEPRD